MCWPSEKRRRAFRSRSARLPLLLVLLIAAGAADGVLGAEDDPELAAEIKAATDVAMRHLRFRQQDDGSWDQSVAATALAARAFARSPRRYGAADGPFVADALAYLAGRADAAEPPEDELALLGSAAALLALAESGNPAYAPVVASLRGRLVDALETEGDDGRFAGGRRPRVVLLVLDALRAAGLPESRPLWARADRWAEDCEREALAPQRPPVPGAGGAGSAPCAALEPADLFAAAAIRARAGSSQPSSWPRRLLAAAVLAERPGREPPSAHEAFFAATALAAWTRAGAFDADVRRGWRRRLTANLLEGQAFEGFWRASGRDWPAGDPALTTSFAILALSLVDDS